METIQEQNINVMSVGKPVILVHMLCDTRELLVNYVGMQKIWKSEDLVEWKISHLD